MYKRILIATDGSELAIKAMQHGIALAKLDKTPVSIVTVTDNWTPFEMAHDYSRGTTNPIGNYEALATEAAKKFSIRRARSRNHKVSIARSSMWRTSVLRKVSWRPPRRSVLT